MLYKIKKLFRKLFPCKQKHIWKEVKCEYLREQMDWGMSPKDIHYLNVYAITMVCVVTGKNQIVERFSWTKLDEYDRTY